MRLKRFVLATAAILIAAPALAQDRGIGIAAVVDDQVISSVDLADRMALVIGTTGLPDTPETRSRIMPQIIRQLVDEKLQMQEAARDGITVSDAKLKEGIAHIEQQNGKAPGSLDAFLDSKGLSKLSMYAQVRAQIAWSEIVLKKIRPRIKISDQEIARYAHRKEAAATPTAASAALAKAPQGKVQEVLIATIQLPVDAPENEANIRKLAEKLAHDIRSGASFEAVAAQFSSSTGGPRATPFWVDPSQMDKAIVAAVARAGKGGVTDPVRTPLGYQIIKLIDIRRGPAPAVPATATTPAVAAEQEAPAELAFKQILMSLKPDAKPKEAEVLLQLAREVQQSPGKCEEKSMAGAGDLSDLDFRVTLTRALSSDLPEKLRDFLLKLHVGQASDPVITPQGVRLFMLCERIDLPPSKKAPAESEDAVRQAIYAEKLELEAQKYLRDMRRQAFIEVRMH
jgi:peptidyl-prolyl cis-trans isomerase SurA